MQHSIAAPALFTGLHPAQCECSAVPDVEPKPNAQWFVATNQPTINIAIVNFRPKAWQRESFTVSKEIPSSAGDFNRFLLVRE